MSEEMRAIRIEKVTVNIGAGEVGDQVDTAVNLLENMTGGTAVKTTATEEALQFGLRPGLNVGAKITLRGEQAHDFLEKAFQAVGNELRARVFDTQGNFSFGVEEYINMPDMKYDPDIGMQGFDVAVTLERPGYRVKERDDAGDVGASHRITPDEAQTFIRDTFDVEIAGGAA